MLKQCDVLKLPINIGRLCTAQQLSDDRTRCSTTIPNSQSLNMQFPSQGFVIQICSCHNTTHTNSRWDQHHPCGTCPTFLSSTGIQERKIKPTPSGLHGFKGADICFYRDISPGLTSDPWAVKLIQPSQLKRERIWSQGSERHRHCVERDGITLTEHSAVASPCRLGA